MAKYLERFPAVGIATQPPTQLQCRHTSVIARMTQAQATRKSDGNYPNSRRRSSSHVVQRRAECEDMLQLALGSALAKSTATNYASAIRKFVEFCASIGIDEADALPCSDDVLCMFLSDGLGKFGSAHAKNLLSGIRSWHVRNNEVWNPSLRIELIKRSLDRFKPDSLNPRPQRLPVSPNMMKALYHAWSRGNNQQKCALACAISAWVGQMRLGELMPATASLLDRDRLPLRSNWRLSASGDGSSSLFLPWSKTTRWNGAQIQLTAQKSEFDATTALQAHFRGSLLPPSALICEFVSGNSIKLLDKKLFMEMCNNVWSGMGLARYTGHSFRIGGTTMFLRLGVDPGVVKKMGRWKSDAFQLYWRDLDNIFKLHASNVVSDDW